MEFTFIKKSITQIMNSDLYSDQTFVANLLEKNDPNSLEFPLK